MDARYPMPIGDGFIVVSFNIAINSGFSILISAVFNNSFVSSLGSIISTFSVTLENVCSFDIGQPFFGKSNESLSFFLSLSAASNERLTNKIINNKIGTKPIFQFLFTHSSLLLPTYMDEF